ncbi:hypothetical protein [Nitratireductor pacificus]|uniref:hypothetical protein n=1 Tax=Nitratireductor pacificus TaxID=1231180 RepID=UPI0002EC75FD|nr:hypothetical protein [Nitratireductor pacificus]
MPTKPLIERQVILALLDELAESGLSATELDVVITRHGPVDLDLLQECKSIHPKFRGRDTRRPRPFARWR